MSVAPRAVNDSMGSWTELFDDLEALQYQRHTDDDPFDSPRGVFSSKTSVFNHQGGTSALEKAPPTGTSKGKSRRPASQLSVALRDFETSSLKRATLSHQELVSHSGVRRPRRSNAEDRVIERITLIKEVRSI